MPEVMRRLRGGGHEPSTPEQDTETSFIVECVACFQVVGIDGWEKPFIFGAVDQACSMGVARV